MRGGQPIATQQRAGTCLTPENPEIKNLPSIVLSQSDIKAFEENLTQRNANMDVNAAAFMELAKSVQQLGNSQAVRDALEPVKAVFDGSNADAFAKWQWMMDDVYEELNHDDRQTIVAAARTLKGSASDFFRGIKRQHKTWISLRDAVTTRYAHLNPAPRAKIKLSTVQQNSN